MKVFQGGELHAVIGCFAIGDFLLLAVIAPVLLAATQRGQQVFHA
jgi:hypothetical protein